MYDGRCDDVMICTDSRRPGEEGEDKQKAGRDFRRSYFFSGHSDIDI